MEAHTASASELATHWQEHAHHQMQLTQAAGARETLERLKALEVGGRSWAGKGVGRRGDGGEGPCSALRWALVI